MTVYDERNRAVTPRTWERFLGGLFLFGSFLTIIYGFGTSQSDGSSGTALIAIALCVLGVLLIRGTRFSKR